MRPGSVLAQLHPNEMVLPAGISSGLQNMIAGRSRRIGSRLQLSPPLKPINVVERTTWPRCRCSVSNERHTWGLRLRHCVPQRTR
jgi:hypothetical protein